MERLPVERAVRHGQRNRTGRAERSGKAFTFVTHDDRDAIRDIERVLEMLREDALPIGSS